MEKKKKKSECCDGYGDVTDPIKCVTVWERGLQGVMTQLTVTWLDYKSWHCVHAGPRGGIAWAEGFFSDAQKENNICFLKRDRIWLIDKQPKRDMQHPASFTKKNNPV